MDIARYIAKKVNFVCDGEQLKEILSLFMEMSTKMWQVILYFPATEPIMLNNSEKEMSRVFVVKDDLTGNDVELLYYIKKCQRRGDLVFKVAVSAIDSKSHIQIDSYYLFDCGAAVLKKGSGYEVVFEEKKIIELKNNFQQLVDISLQEKARFELKEPLSFSADYCYDIAEKECTKDYVDSESCTWYHSIWQYLRLLNMVSSPEWHSDFYIYNIRKMLSRKISPRILISGTADYSMLAYIIYCCEITYNVADIFVIDLCKTPLTLCSWYAKRKNINITIINDDILKHSFDGIKFDLICTDAFLTRFSETTAYNIISVWRGLLVPNGYIVTTVRVRDNKKIQDSNLSSHSLKMRYVQEACLRYEKWKHFLSLSVPSFRDAVLRYIDRMSSSNLGSCKDVLQLIRDCNGTVISSDCRITTGELEVTKYLEVVFC